MIHYSNMLIIGHRGARGLKPENTIASIRAGINAGIDIVEFDIRLSKDHIPVLNHDFLMLRIHHTPRLISSLTLSELQKRTAGSTHPIVTLEAALEECVGKVIVNIELKQKDNFEAALPYIQKYIQKKNDMGIVHFLFFFYLRNLIKNEETGALRAIVAIAPS